MIDSQYVFRHQPTAMEAGVGGPLATIRPEDVVNLEVIKGAAAQRWSACPGEGAVLIQLKDRSWRPTVAPPA